MSRYVDVESSIAQSCEISDRRFRAWQYDEIGVAGDRAARSNANDFNRRLGIERIEIVEIGNVRQDRHSDPDSCARLRWPVLLQRQRILRGEQVRVWEKRKQTERFPTGHQGNALHTGSEQRRIAAKFVDDKPADQHGVLGSNNRLGTDKTRDDAATINIA